MSDERYLGDGLYASFDGFMIKLRAPHINERIHSVMVMPIFTRGKFMFH